MAKNKGNNGRSDVATSLGQIADGIEQMQPETPVTTPATKTRANGVMSAEVSGTTIKWTFTDGQVLVFDANNVPTEFQPAMIAKAMMHGFKQRIADAAAMSRSAVTGQSATVAEKRAAMIDVIQALYSGQWTVAREGDGGILLEAMVRSYPGRDRESLKKWIDGKSDAERAALLKSERLVAHVAAIRAERAAAAGLNKVSDALFDELDKAASE